MTQPQALQKRIKRHLIGPEHPFFIATEPHLAQICFDELKSLLPHIKDAKVVTGGVEFSGRLTDCYLTNLKLRTANRVLMRIADFKATNFAQLEKKTRDIAWELYLNPNKGLRVSVTAQKSRLYHKDAVKERVLAGVLQKVPGLAPSDSGQQIFVRGVEDRFAVSLDSSGDLLYKRGIKPYGHKAPMRETLAAAGLLLGGYKPGEPLIDPMCGSGTFSIEAALMTRNIPPGWFRRFAFMDWPAFKRNQWAYLKKTEQTQMVPPTGVSIFASDTDQKTCESLINATSDFDLSDIILVDTKDFFQFSPSGQFKVSGTVAINPPYGLRIRSGGEKNAFFKQIINHLALNYKAWQFILVVPDKNWLKDIPFGHSIFPVFHGGLTVYLVFGKI